MLKDDPRLADRLPPHKTLFGASPGKGLPIGSPNSQFFANGYLDALDQFAKRELKCRSYLRLPRDVGRSGQRVKAEKDLGAGLPAAALRRGDAEPARVTRRGRKAP